MHGPCRAAYNFKSKSNAETQRKTREDAEKANLCCKFPTIGTLLSRNIDPVFSASLRWQLV